MDKRKFLRAYLIHSVVHSAGEFAVIITVYRGVGVECRLFCGSVISLAGVPTRACSTSLVRTHTVKGRGRTANQGKEFIILEGANFSEGAT
jgi:hypothetical protein